MKISLVLLLFTSISTFAQEKLYDIFPYKNSSIVYEEVVQVDSTTKDQLYERVKNWGLSFYNSQKDVLQLDDKQTGILAYKGFFTVSFTTPKFLGQSTNEDWNYWNTVKVLIKDNKAKVIISDISIKTPSGSFPIEGYQEYIDGFKTVGNKYKEAYKDAVYENFKSADARLDLILFSVESALKSKVTKSEFDF